MAGMSVQMVAVAGLLMLLCAPLTSAQRLFVPLSCARLCSNVTLQNVSSAADDFLNIDPSVNATRKLAFTATRISTWAVALLKTVKMAVPAPPAAQQTLTLTPPAVARLLGAYSIAVYQAYAVWSEYLYPYGRYFAPLTSDMVNLADSNVAAQWDVLTRVSQDIFSGEFAPAEAEASAAQEAAVSGAASRFIELFFCAGQDTTFWCNGNATADVLGARAIINRVMDFVGRTDQARYPIPFAQGRDIAAVVFQQTRMTALLELENLASVPAELNPRPSQTATPTVHNCNALTGGVWSWQRLTVPRSKLFTPNISSPVFPPPSYRNSGFVTGIPVYRGFKAEVAGPVLKNTVDSIQMLTAELKGPPRESNKAGFQEAMREVLLESATLNDAKKVIAEFWADGPESTTPPGHWYKMAIEESNINADFAMKSLNLVDRTIWATLNVGVSLHEAGVLAWRLKRQYFGARPITGIQCGLTDAKGLNGGSLVTAWRGPYLGIGRRNISEWQPFQPIDFVTPPFAGYVSGHATFSAAAAEALRQLRSSYNTTFTTPGYNCYLTERGFSSIEPMIQPGERGYVANVTDRPNRGPRSPGFSPARDVVMCWRTYDEAAEQAAFSRQYGGIHIKVDNVDGLKLGKRIGENVAAVFSRLSPINFLPKAVVSSRPDPLGSTVGNVEQLLCPPDTFVRTLDGRADAMGLYYLVLICSDGTFIGSVGFLGLGGSTPGDIFVASTPTDGWVALTAGLVNNAVVSLSLTSTEGDTTPTYGNSAAQRANRSCQTGERLVGIDVYPSGRIGDLGGIQMLCGESPVAALYRIPEPASMLSAPGNMQRDMSWWYDYQCPEGTYITRFFGRHGSFVSTLTAQCARRWHLRDVGIPFLAPSTDTAYGHASFEGYSGIVYKNFSGGIDSIQFSGLDAGLSPTFGAPVVPGPAYELVCDPLSKIVGIFGWQNEHVVTIGITCSTGPFDVLTASETIPPRLRTIRQEPRMPGGYNITAAVDPTKPTSQALPQVRITTHVATHHRNSAKVPAVAITTVAAKGTPVTQAGVRIVTEAGPNQQAVVQPGADTAHDATAAASIPPTSHLESSAVAHQTEHRGTAEPQQRAANPQQP